MFLTIPMMIACSVSWPFSSNPNNYQPINDYYNYGLYVQIDTTLIAFENGYDNVLLSYFDSNTGSRTSLLTMTVSTDNNNQITTFYITAYETFNYYGFFTIYEPGTDINNAPFTSYVKFYDNQSLEYSFNIPYSDINPDLYYDYSYTFQLNYLDTEQFDILSNSSTDTAYHNGYTDGYSSGYTAGESTGYQNGVTTGERTGYQNGYRAGIASVTSDFGFLNLFGAIADTPVMLFRNLFNFDLFGTSMLVVVLSLFTALVLMKIVKKIFK